MKGTSATDNSTGKTNKPLPPVNRSDLMYNTANNDPQMEDEFSVVFYLERGGGGGEEKGKKETRTKFQCPQCNVGWGCVLVLSACSTTQNCISEDCSTSLRNKHKTQTYITIPMSLYSKYFFTNKLLLKEEAKDVFSL